jgi:hypothetical protein
MDEWTKKAAETFAGDRFAVQVTGARLEQAGENYARCSLALEDRHRKRQPSGDGRRDLHPWRTSRSPWPPTAPSCRPRP